LDWVISAIAGCIIAVISTLGYWGVVFLMALESACLPVPSEIVMPFSGYLASTGRFGLLPVVTAGAFGCSMGSAAAYAAGATGGRALVEKWGPYIFLHKAELDRFERYFRRFGAVTVFFARLLPMVPAIVSVPAGIAKMPFWKFLAYTFAGTWLWCGFLALLGFELGKAWNSSPLLKRIQGPIDAFVAVAIALGLCWMIWRLWRRRSRMHGP
jgi:membrane protein DedA with SNARE-associated domain